MANLGCCNRRKGRMRNEREKFRAFPLSDGLNDYDKEVFNGDIGQIVKIDLVEREVSIRFDQRVSLAYAITIHKSRGSEFPAIVIPLATQHYLILQRNLVYTGVTRGKRLVVLVGQRKA